MGKHENAYELFDNLTTHYILVLNNQAIVNLVLTKGQFLIIGIGQTTTVDQIIIEFSVYHSAKYIYKHRCI